MEVSLDQLKENESGVLDQVSDQDLLLQLMTMGFVIGDEIRLERVAPLNDPILISNQHNSISLRRSSAKKIKLIKA